MLKNNPLFAPYTESSSGLTSYILTRKAAPFQQSFYFVNDCMSSDGRFLWFYAALPPSAKMMGQIDFESMNVRYFPETQFSTALPYVDPHSGAVFFVRVI